MEGSLAPIQVSQEETWCVSLPKPGTKASQNLCLISFCFQFLQIIFTVFILLWLWLIPVPVPILILQLLFQPLFQTQLVLRKPIQVPVLLLVPIPVSHTFPTQTSSQNQGGAGPASRESRGEVSQEASPTSSPTAGHQNYCSCT